MRKQMIHVRLAICAAILVAGIWPANTRGRFPSP